MPEYIFWQKKIIKAKNLNHALRIEKKVDYKFDSVQEHEDKSEQELTSCIGFTVDREYDYDEE